MTDKEYELCQKLMALMVEYDAIGFVGTFYTKEPKGFTTIDIVQPGYDQTGFKKLSRLLDDDIAEVFGGRTGRRENGTMHKEG